jgi:hypothetical protein
MELQVVQQQELLIQEYETLVAVGGKVVGTDQGQTANPGETNATNNIKIWIRNNKYVGANTPARVAAGSSKSGVLMLAESKFLQAEGTKRQIDDGVAKTLLTKVLLLHSIT